MSDLSIPPINHNPLTIIPYNSKAAKAGATIVKRNTLEVSRPNYYKMFIDYLIEQGSVPKGWGKWAKREMLERPFDELSLFCDEFGRPTGIEIKCCPELAHDICGTTFTDARTRSLRLLPQGCHTGDVVKGKKYGVTFKKDVNGKISASLIEGETYYSKHPLRKAAGLICARVYDFPDSPFPDFSTITGAKTAGKGFYGHGTSYHPLFAKIKSRDALEHLCFIMQYFNGADSPLPDNRTFVDKWIDNGIAWFKKNILGKTTRWTQEQTDEFILRFLGPTQGPNLKQLLNRFRNQELLAFKSVIKSIR